MREMSTDRPDKTESAYTVDAGHFQVEMDVLSYGYDRYSTLSSAARTESWAVTPVNLKLGLRNDLDAQLVLQTYNHVRVREPSTGNVTHQGGFGDLIPRLKYNLWGNDGGRTALALMPFLKLPTSQDQLGNNSVEGGMMVPLAIELPGGFGMGVMTELDIIHDSTGSGYHPEFINTITLGRNLIGNLSGYIEFFSLVSEEQGSPWAGTLDVGFTYSLTENLQLDGGVNIGMTRSADDVNPFIGLSLRY